MALARVGPYELLEPLGEGGMGRVYRARDTRLGRIVALKFIRTQPGDRHRQLRFLREAKVEAALSHPNIATILDIGEAEIDHPEIAPRAEGDEPTGPVPYLVLEFVPGEDLAQLATHGPLAAGELLRVARQVAAGLRSAHAAGVIHRDLKPANIRVTPDGLVKILDFGLARFEPGSGPTSDSLGEFATSEGTVVGTVPYLAPEQAMGQLVDARADLFSLGVMLYELASGRLPFHGTTTGERLRSVLRDNPAPLASVAHHVPERFARLVDRLLEKEPADRPGSAREVEQELDAIGRGLSEAETSLDLPRVDGGDARPRASSSAMGASGSRLRSAGRWLVPAVAAALLALGGGLLVRDRRNQAEADRLIKTGRAAEGLTDPQAARIAASAFEQATRLRPRNVTAWAELSRALADAYEHDRRPELLDQAEHAAQRAYELGPRTTDARLARARMERLRGQTDAAIASLESIPKQGAELEAIERELADAWDQKGDPAKAEAHLLAAVAAGPGSWENWNALGRFRNDQSNRPGARAAFEKARDTAPPGITIPQENIAALLFMEGKIDEAIAAYEKIEGAANPFSPSNLGALYYFKGRFDDAEREFRQAIAIAPREPLFHRNLADTLLRVGRLEEARGEYEAALRLVDDLLAETPMDTELRLSRALYLARTGRCEEAIGYASELDRELPASATKAHLLARPFALCGAQEQAIAKVREAIAAGISTARLQSEDELAALRGNSEFDRLMGLSATSVATSR